MILSFIIFYKGEIGNGTLAEFAIGSDFGVFTKKYTEENVRFY